MADWVFSKEISTHLHLGKGKISFYFIFFILFSTYVRHLNGNQRFRSIESDHRPSSNVNRMHFVRLTEAYH